MLNESAPEVILVLWAFLCNKNFQNFEVLDVQSIWDELDSLIRDSLRQIRIYRVNLVGANAVALCKGP